MRAYIVHDSTLVVHASPCYVASAIWLAANRHRIYDCKSSLMPTLTPLRLSPLFKRGEPGNEVTAEAGWWESLDN